MDTKVPKLEVVEVKDAPRQSRTSTAVRQVRDAYDAFLAAVPQGKVGKLVVEPTQVRSVKVRLRHASSRLKVKIATWDDGKAVYFQRVAPPAPIPISRKRKAAAQPVRAQTRRAK